MTDVISETAEALETAIGEQTVEAAATATVVAAAVASEAIEEGVEQGVARATNIVRDEIQAVTEEVIQWQQVVEKVDLLRDQLSGVQMNLNSILEAQQDLAMKLTTQTTVVIPPSAGLMQSESEALPEAATVVESPVLEPDLSVAGVLEVPAPPARRRKVGNWI
ncbi:MAG: hypothetical protein MN733_07635 [Nitrososphaera sp.]|nr:hypothetical protein [Nitrososphaera sp.]